MTDRIRIPVHHQERILSPCDHQMRGVIARPCRLGKKVQVARSFSKYSTRHGAQRVSNSFFGNSDMSAPYLKQQLARDAMQIYSITVAVAEGADLSCPRRRPKFLC